MEQNKKTLKKAGKTALRIFAAAAVIAAIVLVIGVVKNRAAEDVEAGRSLAVKDAVERAARQCYAVEGVYPRTLGYLEEHYGLMINHDRYIVSYDCCASNRMPYIMVLRR